jgi:hemoglobin
MRRALSSWSLAAAALLPLLGLAACSDGAPPPEPPKPVEAAQPASLYDRLGGKPAISAIVDDFVVNIATDKRINRSFRKANMPRFKAQLVDQLCAASGGPCQYAGKSMKEAHKGMGISNAAFNALIEDLRKSLTKFNVPEQEQGELLAVLGPMKADILAPAPMKHVAKPAHPAPAKPAATAPKK